VTLSVLIVDDSNVFLDVARELLTRDGLEVLGEASTIAQALALAPELRPDVILIDINLGDESGFELARRLHESDGDGPSAMILTSTHSQADFAELIEESPANGFLAKHKLSGAALLEILEGDPR
jgi:DNA-binding NarL/FixJ family response regulator